MRIVTKNSDLLPLFFIQLITSVTPIVAGKRFSDVGLYFVKSPEPIVAPLNDDVVFDCSLNIAAESIKWRHNRKYLQQNRTSSSRSSITNQLIIKLENEEQLGDYQCVALFGASALASVPAKLSLAEMKPFSHQPEKQYQVTVGNMVSIFCPPPVSNPAALIEYYYDGRKLFPPSARILPTSNSLLLLNVTEQDSGVYTCSATNYITGQTFHSPFRVALTVSPAHSTIPSSPRFLATPQNNYVVQSGSNVTIECAAVGEPPPKVSWSKVGDSHWLHNNRTEYVPGGLHIRNIVPDDTGEYVCEMDNEISPVLRHKVLLHVQEAPVILKEPNRMLVEEQGDTELSCETAGNPIPTVSWTLNGDWLENDAHILITSSKIKIKRAQKKHAGIYQCFATNGVGTAYGSGMLQVSPKQITVDMSMGSNIFDSDDDWTSGGRNRSGAGSNHSRGHNHGKKDRQRKNKLKRKHKENEIMVPPTKPNVTRLTDRSVMVRWHVPPNNGLPISFFKVQYKEVGNNETGKNSGSRWMTNNEDIAPHIRSYAIEKLEPNKYYKFRVAAVYSNNDNKLGPNSLKFFLPHEAPTDRNHLVPPTILVAEALSPTSLRIEWQYHASKFTPVDGFYVYYRATDNAGDYSKFTVDGENTRSCVITHLTPNTSYDVKIQSFTMVAASNFSGIITRKTLVDPTLTTTETTSPNDLKRPNVSVLSSTSSTTVQLLMVFGGVLGALVILFLLVILVCFFKQRSLGDRSDEDENTTDKNADNMTIHQVEPVTMNGYANHNNTKMMNGSMKSCSRNGYITPHNHINITSNPLATESKHEKNMMEMSYLSKYNNNCTIDRCVDSDSDCSRDVNKWKLREREQRPQEKYV